MSLHHLGLFLDADIVLLKEESQKLASSINDEKEDFSQLKEQEIRQELAEDDLELVYEGNFEKGVLVIYEGSHLEPALREFLFKILQAVNCSLKDVALSSSESVAEVPMPIIQAMSANKVVVFGKLQHDLMNSKKHPYEITQEEGVEYMFVDSVQEILDNQALKKTLWNKLQVLFNIKK